jgi:very-short-patch-repair endonuclease
MKNDYDSRIKEIMRRQFRTQMHDQARRRQGVYEAMADLCDSPIERLLLAPLMFIQPKCLHPHSDWPLDPSKEHKLHAQHMVAGYRIDFAYIVTPYRETPIRIAIECDGHDFHSSRDQRGRDADQGRALLAAGWHLVRFTGSQIHADPEECVQQIADVVDQLWFGRLHGDAA